MYRFIVGERGSGKLAFHQKILPVRMANEKFYTAKFKATTVIKFEGLPDIYVFYYSDLKHIHYDSKANSEDDLISYASYFQNIFILNSNSKFGGFAMMSRGSGKTFFEREQREQGFIDFVEFALDNGFKLHFETLKKYETIINERRKNNEET